MRGLIDLTGKRFGKLTVLGLSRSGENPNGSRFKMWNVVCDCGTQKQVNGHSLRRGLSKSCGCRQGTVDWVKHGHARKGKWSSEYAIWNAIKQRTKANTNKNKCYADVHVCERWRNSFELFLEDMGERPSKDHSIDRIDPYGNYEPQNCRWATKEQQASNKRKSIRDRYEACRAAHRDDPSLEAARPERSRQR